MFTVLICGYVYWFVVDRDGCPRSRRQGEGGAAAGRARAQSAEAAGVAGHHEGGDGGGHELGSAIQGTSLALPV